MIPDSSMSNSSTPNSRAFDVTDLNDSIEDNLNVSEISPVIVQQRHIMALVGLDIWVQRDKPTVTIDYKTIVNEQNAKLHQTDTEHFASNKVSMDIPVSTLEEPVHPSTPSSDLIDNEIGSSTEFTAPSEVRSPNDVSSSKDINTLTGINAPVNVQNFTSQPNVTTQPSSIDPALRSNPIAALKEKIYDNETLHDRSIVNENEHLNIEQVAAFEIMGAHYHDWVLLVDVTTFKDTHVLQLWENLLNALSLKTQRLKFPICEGIMDKDSANASVAGFIFSFTKTDSSKVAALTPLPEGIDNEDVIRVPYLSEMLEDSRHKRALWKLLNDNISV